MMRRSGRMAFMLAMMSYRFWPPRLPSSTRSMLCSWLRSASEAETSSKSGSVSNRLGIQQIAADRSPPRLYVSAAFWRRQLSLRFPC